MSSVPATNANFTHYQAATALASDLVDRLETLRAAVVSSRELDLADMEDLLLAEISAKRALRLLLRLTQTAANRAAAEPVASGQAAAA